jgi:hypothetical protein
MPLREALELASGLTGEAMPAEEAGAATGEAAQPMGQAQQGKGQPMGQAQAQGQGQPMPGEGQGQPMPGQGQPMPGQGQGQPQNAQGAPKGNPQMGTGLVPNSPEVTAQMMAGPQAMSQLTAMMAAAQAQAQGEGQPGQGQGQPMPGEAQSKGQGQQPPQGETSPMGKGGTSKSGQVADNQAVKEGPLELSPGAPDGNDSRTATEKRDSDAAGKQFREDAWFAKLPPELRNAIRARSQRQPPRGYEERLRRYFENID